MSGARVRTTCPYCGVGCGLVASREGMRIEIAGDPEHPANAGRTCSKGASLGETLAGAAKTVALNHPHCARFCVLGGASCSG